LGTCQKWDRVLRMRRVVEKIEEGLARY
jgi:hypothetical protein